jgi:hypothetical protein
MGGSKPRRTGANDGHLLIPLYNLRHGEIFNVHLISHKPLQSANGNGLIHLTPSAGGLTRMGTDATDGSGEGQGPEDDLHGLLVFALGNEGHISMGVYLVRATIGTGGTITLVNHVSPWDGLRVGFVGGLPGTDTLIELAGHSYRANLGTITATGALVQMNIARLFPYSDLETARLPGYALQVCTGKKFYVEMPADLDQFRRDDSHGAIVGGKGLV